MPNQSSIYMPLTARLLLLALGVGFLLGCGVFPEMFRWMIRVFRHCSKRRLSLTGPPTASHRPPQVAVSDWSPDHAQVTTPCSIHAHTTLLH